MDKRHSLAIAKLIGKRQTNKQLVILTYSDDVSRFLQYNFEQGNQPKHWTSRKIISHHGSKL
jgi:hypothetical protein